VDCGGYVDVTEHFPTELADKLPALRYTGSHRRSAGMMVSIALSDYLEKKAHELAI